MFHRMILIHHRAHSNSKGVFVTQTGVLIRTLRKQGYFLTVIAINSFQCSQSLKHDTTFIYILTNQPKKGLVHHGAVKNCDLRFQLLSYNSDS